MMKIGKQGLVSRNRLRKYKRKRHGPDLSHSESKDPYRSLHGRNSGSCNDHARHRH